MRCMKLLFLSDVEEARRESVSEKTAAFTMPSFRRHKGELWRAGGGTKISSIF
jgi:hypothetical protein